jgi:hypothetical protein
VSGPGSGRRLLGSTVPLLSAIQSTVYRAKLTLLIVTVLVVVVFLSVFKTQMTNDICQTHFQPDSLATGSNLCSLSDSAVFHHESNPHTPAPSCTALINFLSPRPFGSSKV